MRDHTSTVSALALVLVACADAEPAGDPASTGETTAASSSDHGEALTGLTTASSETSDGSVDTSSSSGGELDCELPPGSPPSLLLDGYTLVPIDTLAVAAALSFDVDAEAARGTASLTFAVGPEGGMPIFDLRQTITAIELDGVDLGADRAPFFQPSNDPDARMRALAEPLAPCSEHTLVLEYALEVPDAEGALPPTYEPAGMFWSSKHSDRSPGRYAEQWWPMNLPHDALDIAVEIEVVGSTLPHMLVSNGDVVQLAEYQWRVEFPAEFTALSPMLVLAPELLMQRGSAQVDLPEGVQVTIEAVVRLDHPDSVADLLAATGEALIATDLELGDYPHGDRYLVSAGEDGNSGGMEYSGGTSTWLAYVDHEVFHSWIGRGLAPLNPRDGWLDEAWTTFAIDGAYTTDPLPARPPFETLAPADPWTRVTLDSAYETGSRLLATIAADVGVDEMRGLLREFYLLHAGEGVTTEELELFLVCATTGDTVHDAFARVVHGRMPAPGPVDRSDCP